ncbi:asparagine synthase-related protein [Aurantiacibacter poecillastricola]|uniref:asparagine synthase-related protein n=1 Tax=Aurantiacibacter poecillastricola TaxID=3064385 RepID=UPI00273DB8AE|nr:asparagine synthase-related protein [Aurantiacibacter sp. 219JJ12-13]MDP5263060.1 asparagine synthase-related protein [Aurantiacibacter sp. 219JJ12-13]
MTLFCGSINLFPEDCGRNLADDLAAICLQLEGKGTGDTISCSIGPLHGAVKRLAAGGAGAEHGFAKIEEGGLVSIGSARIDNRRELAETLRIELTGDLDLVLHAYARWGQECAQHLLGDFALCIIDERTGTIVAMRDPGGGVPFFYALCGGIFSFSNDQSAVAAAPSVPDEMDDRLVASFLDINLVLPPGRTLHRHIQRLRPGHLLTLGRGQSRVSRWWSRSAIRDVRYSCDNDYIDALDELLGQAIGDRAAVAVRPASHVSGGLDSSIVTAKLAAHCQDKGAPSPLALTWNPVPRNAAESAHPEAAVLAAFCNALGIEPLRLPPDVEGILEYLQRDPLRHPPSAMLLMEIALQTGAADRGVDTIFSGHGGDQCLSSRGGTIYSDLLVSGRWKKLAREAAAIDRSAAKIAAGAVFQFFRRLGAEALQELPRGTGSSRNPYRSESLSRLTRHRRVREGIYATNQGRSWHRLQSGYIDMRTDAWFESGSRRGLRYAYPLLDRRILEFSLGLPPEMFARGKEGRWLIRQVARRHLPHEVSENRNKEEPSRSLAMVEALEAARPRMIAALERSRGTWDRHGFIDAQRLLEDLKASDIAPRGGKSPNFRTKRVALEMMDLDWDDQ